MRMFFAIVLIASSVPSIAMAGNCEQSFSKKGLALLGGTTFASEVTVADVTSPNAIYQLRGVATSKGYVVIADEAQSGSMLLEQPESSGARAIPVNVTATEVGNQSQIKLEMKLPSGMSANTDSMRKEICLILNAIKGGPEGLAAAEQGKGAAAISAAPLKMSATRFALKIEEELSANPALVQARYPGKSFTITGKVDQVRQRDGVYSVFYDVTHDTFDRPSSVGLQCRLAPGQGPMALRLKAGDLVTFTGQYENYDATFQFVKLTGCVKAAG